MYALTNSVKPCEFDGFAIHAEGILIRKEEKQY